jgi:hypothetical protein
VTDKPKDVQALLPCFDVLGIDPYPVGNHGDRAESPSAPVGRTKRAATPSGCAACGMCRRPSTGLVPSEGSGRHPDAEPRGNRQHDLAACRRRSERALFLFLPFDAQEPQGEAFDKAWADVCAVAFEVKSVEAALLSDGRRWLSAAFREGARRARLPSERQGLAPRREPHDGASKGYAHVAAPLRIAQNRSRWRCLVHGRRRPHGRFPAIGYAFVELGM